MTVICVPDSRLFRHLRASSIPAHMLCHTTNFGSYLSPSLHSLTCNRNVCGGLLLGFQNRNSRSTHVLSRYSTVSLDPQSPASSEPRLPEISIVESMAVARDPPPIIFSHQQRLDSGCSMPRSRLPSQPLQRRFSTFLSCRSIH